MESSLHVTCSATTRSQDFCQHCSRISFDDVFRKPLPRTQREILHLNHIWVQSNCSLCKFFRACIRQKAPEEHISRPRLILGRTSPVFGTHRTTDTAMFRLMRPKNTYDKRGNGVILDILPVHGHHGVSGQHIQRGMVSYEIVNRWLSFCDKHHQACSKGKTSIYPTAGMRVIDCIGRVLVPLPNQTNYVALSYVWGSPAGDGTISEEFPTKAPTVVEDAMRVVIQLGLQYLWVDRYCIPQHDEKLKHAQIQSMGKIYANSALTIISAAGTDAEYGLPGVGSRIRTEQPCIRVGRQCLVGYSRPGLDIKSSEWNTRGWTYQEAVLSTRRLVFTEQQVCFQCQAMHCVEGISIPLQDLHGRGAKFFSAVNFGMPLPSTIETRQSDLKAVWAHIGFFWPRHLSLENDAINAVSGVLTIYRDQKSIQLLCGLPINPSATTNDLITALQWNACAGLVRRPEFPSWTWAGWKWAEGSIVGEYNPVNFLTCAFCLPGTIIAIEFEDGTVLEWAKEQRLILGPSTTGQNPKYLNVSGWVFAAKMTFWKGGHIPSAGWKFTSPPSLSEKITYSLPDIGLAQTDDATHDVVVWVLGYRSDGWAQALMLMWRENTNSFERVDNVTFSLSLRESVIDGTSYFLRLGTLQLEKRQFRIG